MLAAETILDVETIAEVQFTCAYSRAMKELYVIRKFLDNQEGI